MKARLEKLLDDLSEAFWLTPTILVLAGMLLAYGLAELEREGRVPAAILAWTYGGGETGARTLLGAITSSTITVAGTIFSITIAALTLASSQMGPRLLHNFTRDLGNQTTLGVLLGTFAYALMLLRSVRGGETVFIPQLALSVGVALSVACIGAVVYFVYHMANRINVGTVIDLVHRDLQRSILRLTEPAGEPTACAAALSAGCWVDDDRTGYVQQVDEARLAKWASENGSVVQLLLRPGDFLHPGSRVARVDPPAPGAADVVRSALVVGRRKAGFADLESGIDQLVEVAARALSSGINDPITANRVLDRLGASLCTLASRDVPGAAVLECERLVLIRKSPSYADLAGAMFNVIRQCAAGQPAVLIHMMDVLGEVAVCERRPARLAVLRLHAEQALADGRAAFRNASDRAELEARHRRFTHAAASGEPVLEADEPADWG